jgi:two-component system phosphate regulon response regulator PhoB
VLVVEDDPQTRELYRRSLVSSRFRVAAVEDGLDALRFLDDDVPDAVVLDLMLPRLGGLDVYKEMRSRDETRNVPVVIVTGTDVRDLEPSQYLSFLRKPVHPEVLAAAVEDAIRRARHRPR